MEHDLTKGPITRTLITFVIPFLVSTIIQFCYTIADLVVLGRFASSVALSAVNTSGQIMMILTCMIVGLATGGTIVIGQAFGAGNRARVKQAVTGILYVFIGTSIILTVFTVILTDPLIAVTRVPGESAAPAADYLRICAFGFTFITGYNCISGILRGIGDSKHPMYFVIVSSIFNIVGDLILVGGLGMGAAGAAYATVLAQLLAFILSIVILQKSEYPISKETFRFLSEPFRDVLKIGIPLGLQEVLPTISFLMVTVMINAMGFVERSAGVGVVERVVGVGTLFPIAFTPAISAFTAQNVGAEEYGRTRKGLQISITICLVATGICWALAFLFPELTLSVFTKEPEVIRYGADYLRSYCFDMPLVSFVFCLNGFFSGYGKTRFTMANCIISTFCVRVPIVYFACRIPDVSFVLVGCAAPITSVIQIVMQLFYYRFGAWRKIAKM